MKKNNISILFIQLLFINLIFTLSCDNSLNIDTCPETIDVFYISTENIEYHNKVTYNKGHKLTAEDIPKLSSNDTHDFINWVDDKGNNISEGYNLTKNQYFFASWKQRKVYPVSFSEESFFLDYKESVTLSTKTKDAKIYFTLDGTTPTTKSNLYDEKIPIILFTEGQNLDKIITIKAIAVNNSLDPSSVVEHKYSMKTYTLTFDNKGYGIKPATIKNLKKGDIIELQDLGTDDNITPNKIFIGWMDNNIPVKDNIIISDNLKLEAIWTDYKQINNVQFSKKGNVDYLDEVKLICPIPGVDIYYTLNGSNPTDLSNASRILYESPLQIKENITIKAYATHKKLPQSEISDASYTIKKYTVTFRNDKNLTDPPKMSGFKKNDTITKENIPILNLEYYDFEGWKDNDGNLFDSNYKITKDIIVKAIFKPISYNINYVLNTDSSNIININPTSYTIEDQIILKTDIRSGWVAQWYDNKAHTGSIVTSIPKGSTGDRTLYAKWIDIAPSEVTNLTAIPDDGKVTLSWNNPIEKDLSKVIITYDSNISIEIDIIPNTETKKEINSLSNGKSYTFTIKTIDKQGNESNGVSITSKIGKTYKYTEKPQTVNTKTINGKSYKIVEFGDWPQTVYNGDISLLKQCDNINSWDNCYTDGKDNFYVRVIAKPWGASCTYSDGTKVEDGKNYYFKFEPIRWRVLSDTYNGHKLLLAEKVLTNHLYFDYRGSERELNGETIHDNNYKESEIRAFLNGRAYINAYNQVVTAYYNKGFLQKAFTQKSMDMIENTIVDNSAESTTDAGNHINKATDYICENTTDKIFLLSQKEVTTSDYGFDIYNHYLGDDYGTTSSTRQLKPTDYAKANGIWFSSISGTSDWWLRSPLCNFSYRVQLVSLDGDPGSYRNVDNKNGIVPALSISF